MLFNVWQSIRPVLGAVRSTYQWVKSGYAVPNPHYMKQATILRFSIPQSVFIETGTYKGATSRYFQKRGFKVATIEVDKLLFDTYSGYLQRLGIDTRLGDSADVMPLLLDEYAAKPAFTIFLDGHYSAGITGKGVEFVPVVKELDTLRDFALSNPSKDISIIIDDVRLFMPGGDPNYPLKSTLLDFANSISAEWKFENDLFICLRPLLVESRSINPSGQRPL